MTVSSEFVRHLTEEAMRGGGIEEDAIVWSLTLDTEEDARLMADSMPATFKHEVNMDVKAVVSEVMPRVVTFRFPKDLAIKLLGL